MPDLTNLTGDERRTPAAVAKLYVLAVLNEMAITLATARSKYVTDLSGDEPFKLLLASEKHLRRTEEPRTDA